MRQRASLLQALSLTQFLFAPLLKTTLKVTLKLLTWCFLGFFFFNSIHIWPVGLSTSQDYKQSNPSWVENKVNPLYDPATICDPGLVIGLLYALHPDLIPSRDSVVYINSDACIFFTWTAGLWASERHILKQPILTLFHERMRSCPVFTAWK